MPDVIVGHFFTQASIRPKLSYPFGMVKTIPKEVHHTDEQ